MRLARRSNIPPSLTLEMNAKAQQMKAQGIDVISFAAGEPDFPTPGHVKTAGKRAIDENKTYYTPASGIPELRRAVIRKLKEENGLNYTIDEVTINAGAKHSVYNVLAALIDRGDEVLIPSPYWVSYSEMVHLCEGEATLLPTTDEKGFKITHEDLKEAVSKKTKALILNSPNNPTGAVYSREELFSLADFLEDRDIIVISDEIYEKILYDGNTHTSIASYSEKMKQKTVVVNGVSKAFSMTGWRIGYAAGPKEIMSAVNKIQGHSCGNPCSISQWASLAAVEKEATFIKGWVSEFRKRRNFIVDELNSLEFFSCMKPGGAFYVFPNVSKLYDRTFNGYTITNSIDLANYLLEHAKISVVPGKAFGADEYIRISFATSMENIIEGMKRLRGCFSE